MGNKYLTVFIETEKNPELVKKDVAQIFRSTGGTIYSTPTGFMILGGTTGAQMAFTANLTANIFIQPVKDQRYEVQVFLNWTWGSWMWAFLIMGFFLGGLTWLLLFLYLFFDPAPAYQQALFRLASYERQ